MCYTEGGKRLDNSQPENKCRICFRLPTMGRWRLTDISAPPRLHFSATLWRRAVATPHLRHLIANTRRAILAFRLPKRGRQDLGSLNGKPRGVQGLAPARGRRRNACTGKKSAMRQGSLKTECRKECGGECKTAQRSKDASPRNANGCCHTITPKTKGSLKTV